jgi:hypothetical protein
MEHLIHLAAHNFITHIAPTTSSRLAKKVKAALRSAHDTGKDQDKIDLDQLNSDLADALNCNDNDNDEALDDEFDVADAVGKALALVKQVSHL